MAARLPDAVEQCLQQFVNQSPWDEMLVRRVLALRIRPANIQLRNNANRNGEELPVRWLLVEWPSDKDEPTKHWLSNLPADTPLKDLLRLGKLRWRIEHDYRELKDALGLDHFEGRTYRGWSHHVTLVSITHALGMAV
jgi:SRSO17 transposase